MTRPPASMGSLLAGLDRNYPHVFQARPGRPPVRLHMVLLFAQGHHLAGTGQPLFVEPIVRTDDAIVIDLPADFTTAGLPSEFHFGRLGYAAARYGRMTVTDLRAVLQATAPWQDASVGDPVDLNMLQAWFRRVAETDDPDDDRPNSAEMAEACAWFRAQGL